MLGLWREGVIHIRCASGAAQEEASDLEESLMMAQAVHSADFCEQALATGIVVY